MAKRQASDWYIALNHWLIGGFAIPVLAALLVSCIAAPCMSVDAHGNFLNPQMQLVMQVFAMVVYVAATWLGASRSATYMRKKYTVRHPHVVVRRATWVYVLFPLVLGFVVGIVEGVMHVAGEPLDGATLFINTLQIVAGAAIFYLVSKKYLVN